MRDYRIVFGWGFLTLVTILALLAPWLGLRDPAEQPDGLVLRDLPPLSRVEALRLADGSTVYAHETRTAADGTVDYRRGETWRRLAPEQLAGPEPRDWSRRPLFLLGTDGFGRDMLSRLIHGGRVSIAVGLLAAALAVLVGATVGLISGLAGGWVDSLLMRGTDLMLSVPRLFLLLLLVALFGQSMLMTVLVLGGTTWMTAARLVRGEVLSLRDRDFILAARAAGAAPLRLSLRHLLPGAAAPLLVEATLRVGDAILLEAALSFLKLGVPIPTPSWGNLVADGRDSLTYAWWIATFPGLAVAATVIALNLVGDAARDRLDRRALR